MICEVETEYVHVIWRNTKPQNFKDPATRKKNPNYGTCRAAVLWSFDMNLPGKGKAISMHAWIGFSAAEVEGPRISRQSAHECGKFFNLTHQSPLPRGDMPGTHFWPVGRRVIVRPEGLSQWEITVTIGNRIRDFPACGTVPQPTAPLHNKDSENCGI